MSETTYVLHGNKIVDNVDHSTRKSIIAKRVKTDNLDRFFLRTIGSRLVDPDAMSNFELRKESEYMTEVKQEIYEKYINFLNKKTRTSLQSIERLIDG